MPRSSPPHLGDPSVVALGLPPEYGQSKAEARSAHLDLSVQWVERLATPPDFFDDELRDTVSRLSSLDPSVVSAARERELQAFRAEAAALATASAEARASAPPSVSSVLRAASPGGMHVCLLAHAAAGVGSPDADTLYSDLLQGFPLVGDIPADPLAPLERRPGPVNPEWVLSTAPARSVRQVAKARRGLATASPEALAHLQSVFEKTELDVSLGRMGPLTPVSDPPPHL